MKSHKKQMLSWLLTIALVFGCFAGTGITAKAGGIPTIFSGGISVTPNTLESKGGIVTVSVTNGEDLGENLWYDLCKKTISSEGYPKYEKIGDNSRTVSTNGNSTTPSFEVEIPGNETEEEVTYRIRIKETAPTTSYTTFDSLNWGSHSIEVTVAANEGGGEAEVDKTVLEEAITEAERKSAGGYTKASWTAMQEKLTVAKAVNDNAAATEEEVTEAAKALKAAVKALVMKAIMGVTVTPGELPSAGGNVEVKVTGDLDETIYYLLQKKEEDGSYTVVGEDINEAATTFNLSIPKNAEEKEVTYRVRIKESKPAKAVIGSGYNWQGATDKTFTIAASAGEEEPADPAEITSVTATPTKVSEDGGIVKLEIAGKNLTADNWGIEIGKFISGTDVEAGSKAGEATVTEMTETGATIEISSNGMKNNIDFKFSVGPKDGNKVTPQKEVTVVQEGKSYSTEMLSVASVEMADSSTIIAKFKSEITAAKEGDALKNRIYIADSDGVTNRYNVGEGDTVTVEGNTVTIKYANPLSNVTSSSKLYIKEGALKIVGSGNIAQDISWLITTSAKISAIILDKDVFDSKGGTVTATLNGYRVADIDNEKIEASVYLPGETKPTDIPVNKSKDSEGNPVLTFDVPENTTENTVSYWLNVKYDGSPVYGTSVSNRGDRATVSVLPDGKTEADATLSAMTISGNNKDEVNNTTDIAVNVSSNIGELKTELRIYGTNLDSKLTKVRAIDENGIIWPIYHISECDGTYRFVAIAGEHRNGVFGDGTSQLIEILPPRYIGFNKTYTIQVAIDGEHFIDAPNVKLTINNKGIDGAVDCTSANYKYVTVKYVEQGTGKELAPSEKLTGYYYYMMKSFNITPKEIPGYELVKGFEFTDDDYVFDGKTCTYEYKSTSAAVTPAPVKVSSIKISGISKKIAAGKKVTLKAAVSPANAVNKAVTWKSSNTKYATVNSSGKVTLKKAGVNKTVTITATAKDGSGKKATYKIKIMKNAVKSVKLKAAKTVKAGKKTTVKATVKITGKKVNKTLKWTSSNTKYATVSSKGVVKTKKAGKGKTVKITASSTDGSNKKKTVKIKIK